MTGGRTQRSGIGLASATALVAGNMIGVGVFTTSGFALADLGNREAVLWAWVVGGGIALCGAISYATLARRIPGNGGEYLFLSRAVHPLVGFLAGWVSLLAGFTAPIAVAAHGLEAYVRTAFGGVGPPGMLGASAILAAGLVHGITLRSGLRLQNAAVGFQVLAIVGLVVLGLAAIEPAAPATVASEVSAPSLPAFAVTLVWISFAYSGWNAAVYVAGELHRPERTLPRATLLGTLAVIGLYVALNAVFVYSAPIETLAGRADIGAVAAGALGGPSAQRIVAAIVGLGLWTSISAMTMVGPRIYAQMARDGVLPRALCGGSAPPRSAIALQVGLALAAFRLAELRELLLYVGFLLSLSAAGSVLCLFRSASREDREASRAFGHPWLPLLFVASTLGSVAFMVRAEPAQALAGSATLAIGVVVYVVAVRVGGQPDPRAVER